MAANSSFPAHRLPPVQGTLALDMSTPGLPQQPRPDLRLVPDGRPTPPGTPPAEQWAARFVQAVVEVVAGDRPVQQLVRWTDEAVFADLQHRVQVLSSATSAGVRGRTERSQLRSVRVCQPAPTVAEVSAHVRHGGRSRAIAVRFEAQRGRWLCTALQFG
ncbi:MAG TPA: Rv3235 family protein [Nocardioidaceae bacterium]|nr:Rv3235 family protein [Nocardioidaceae bacterium]